MTRPSAQRVTRAGWVLAVMTLVTAALSGCVVTGAGPSQDVEGTVQARVSATVAAIARSQATPTRGPGGTTVAIPGVASPTVLGGPAAAGTPSPGGTPGGAGTASALAGTVTVTRPAGTPGTGTPSVGGAVLPGGTASPSATAMAAVSLGTYGRLGNFGVTVSRYEWGPECAVGTPGRAAAGRKLVTLQIAGRNDGAGTLTLPVVQWTVEGYPASLGAQLPCQPDEQYLMNACYRSGQLPAGGRCEGWLVFEVPEQLEVPGATVSARGTSSVDSALWRLPG